VKRVVAVTGEDGRSRVLETPAPVPFRWGEIVWPVAPDDPGRTELAPGEVSWRLYTLPSSEELDAYVRERYGDDPRAGMHRTPTTDFVYVIDGRVSSSSTRRRSSSKRATSSSSAGTCTRGACSRGRCAWRR